MAYYSNVYAHHRVATSENGLVSGTKWKSDISVDEMMKFFGILFKMVLRPTPGQTYTSCWNDTQRHPYTVHMRLRRFQQIRSVLHFNENSNITGSNDAAFKVSKRSREFKIDVQKSM
jgi:Transposase IS4